MNGFLKVEKEDGSIEYVNENYDEMVRNTIIINGPIPEDIIALSHEELEIKLLENHKNLVRQERDKKLSECDWTQNIDSPLSEEMKHEWRLYRQILRNLPSTIIDISPIIWPSKPYL